MNSILEGEKRPKTPQVDANRLVNLSSDQLQDTSLSTPGKALEPAGLSDLKGIALVEAENLRLRLHLQRLQGQLTEQRLYQDATHIMIQRAAQVEVDLDHTAAMLCDEMTQGAANSAAMLKVQGLYALEQKHFRMAMAALSDSNLHLCIRHQELRQSNEQLLAALAKLKAAETILAKYNLSSPSSSASIHPTAAVGDVPVMPRPATPSALASSVPPAMVSSHVSSHCSAAQPLGAVQLQRQPSSPCW